MPPKVSPADHSRLTRLVFGRWVEQQLRSRNTKVTDVINDFKSGNMVIDLLEVLAEKKFTGKRVAAPKMRAHMIDNANNALAFAFGECGVDLKIKPSAEDLVDGNELNVLGFLWAVMLKYIKIDDGDEEGASMNAKDALLLWAKNKTTGYAGVDVKSFTTSFSDGLALGAIIHKHRPKLLDFGALKSSTPEHNFQLVLEAAAKYFNLEDYLKADDIPKLDEKCMVIFIADFYYGIAEQRKLDLAARRIGKVVKITEENDRLRAEYNDTADKFVAHVKTVEGALEDRTIDDTMAGAKARLEAFYKYKTDDKGDIMDRQLACEGLFNQLSMRLVQHKRPEFKPKEGCALADLVATVRHLEECEAERQVALHKELNRQIRLAQLEEQHVSRFEKLQAWYTDRQAFLAKKEIIDSISGAVLQLGLLDGYDKEHAGVAENNVSARLKPIGAELITERFERSAGVKDREANVDAWLAELADLSAKKRPVLEDDLAREQFREQLRLENLQHVEKHKEIASWAAEKEVYLAEREVIESVPEAQTAISLLEVHENDKNQMTASNVASLKDLGALILSKEYRGLTTYKFHNPQEIHDREGDVDATWGRLESAGALKAEILDDHLQRETFREKVRVMVLQHVDQHAKLVAWYETKKAYLQAREHIDSVADAESFISLLRAYEGDVGRMTQLQVAQLKAHGADTLAQEFVGKHSTYKWPAPQELVDRESDIDTKWLELEALRGEKDAWLAEKLALEKEKERLRLEFSHQAAAMLSWCKDTTENAELEHFGFNLEEVEAYQAVIASSRAQMESDASHKVTSASGVKSQMDGLGVTHNQYTHTTVADLESAVAALRSAFDGRDARFQVELERQRENDRLCKQFAGLVNPFAEWVDSNRAAVSTSKLDLDGQLANVQAKLATANEQADGAKLPEIRSLHAHMESRNITENKYTNLGVKDVEVMWSQWGSFLGRKKAMLEDEIEHVKLRGVTPEQFAEIEENFKAFDKDKSNTIDKRELRACLYSLGEEKKPQEVQTIMDAHGDGKQIKYEGFREFMIGVLGDSDTKDEIKDGFKLINRGDEQGDLAKMELVMTEYDLAYVKRTAPSAAGKIDYNAWTEDVFSR